MTDQDPGKTAGLIEESQRLKEEAQRMLERAKKIDKEVKEQTGIAPQRDRQQQGDS